MWDVAAEGFAAIGSEARLRVLKILVRAGEPGLSIGEVQERTGIAPSTLAHHLKALATGGVIEQRKVGRTVINTANYETLRELAEFILSECCADQNDNGGRDG